MPKSKKKAGIQQNCHVDSKKIHEELMAKCKLDAEKEKKRIEKQAEQRAQVEKLKKLNLEEQATFIISFKQEKNSETVKNCEKSANLSSAEEERVNCESSTKVLNEIDFDDDGIWSEDYGIINSSYQPADNIGRSSYQEQKKNHEQNEWGSHKENTNGSQYDGKSRFSNKPSKFNNKGQNFDRDTNSSSVKVEKVNGKSSTGALKTDYDGVWDDDYANSSNYQSTQKATANTQHSTYQQGWQTQQWKNKRSENQESNSYRGNARKSFHSNKQQYSNRNQNERPRTDSVRSVTSNKSENLKNSYHPPNSVADSCLDIQDWPDLNEAAAAPPAVNVWEERKAKQESIQQMAPHSNYEEEIMFQQALELSKRQTEEDQRKQREIAKEYEQQQKYLEQNPECLKYVTQYNNIDDYEDDDSEVKHRQASNSNLPSIQSPPAVVNNSSISSYCNGARAKYKAACSPESSYQDPAEYSEDLWIDNDDKSCKLGAVKESAEVKTYDDSPCEDGWEDCVQDIPSHAEKTHTQINNARSRDDEFEQRISTDFVNHLDGTKGFANENGQSCNETSSEYEVGIPWQNMKDNAGSSNTNFSQMSDLPVITIKDKATGMFQNIEFNVNNGQHRLTEEKSFPVLEAKIDQNKNLYPKTSNDENAYYKAHTFSSSRSVTSLKSGIKSCDEILVLQGGFQRKDAEVNQGNVMAGSSQDVYAKSLSAIEFDDNANATDNVPSEAHVRDAGMREIANENIDISYIGRSSIMMDVKKWVESTIVDAPHGEHDIVENKAVPSDHVETTYRPDLTLEPHSMADFTLPNANFADEPNAAYSPPIKPPVQPEVSLPYTLNQLDDNNNMNSGVRNADTPNLVAMPYSNGPAFNPAFMVPNPAMAFNPAIPTSLPITHPSMLNPFELQQILISNSFFAQQLLLSQNYAIQMYQQAAGLQGPFNAAPIALIPSNLPIGSVHVPTNLPHFPVSEPFVSTVSTDPFISMATQSLPINSNSQYTVSNNPSIIAPSSQQHSNPMQVTSIGLPPGLCCNSQHSFDTKVPSDLVRSSMMNEKLQDNGVGIPPPKPPQHLRQPKQNCSELSSLMHQASMRHAGRFSAFGQGHSNY